MENQYMLCGFLKMKFKRRTYNYLHNKTSEDPKD